MFWNLIASATTLRDPPSIKDIGMEGDSSSYQPECAGGVNMPDVTQAEIGRRMYHVHREKRVEHAVKLMQQGLGPAWRSLKEDEIIILGHLLQCAWNRIDQKEWDAVPFGMTGMDTIRKILSYGEGVGPGHNPAPEAVGEIKKILLSLR